MNTNKLWLYDLTYPMLESLLQTWGARSHARTLWRWMYQHGETNFSRMAELPDSLRARLQAEASLTLPRLLVRQESPTGDTRKDLLALADGETVEVVLLRYRERNSVCIYTQVGCACGCRFCATGQMGFVRQMTSGEIVAQVLHVRREEPLSNVVLMGMGEPLLNLEHTFAALRRLIDPRGLAFPPRRITLSTVGIVPGIRQLAEADLGIKLAVSLHAATDEVREDLMPINRSYPLDALFAALREYVTRSGQRVMFEWLMIAGINDTPEQARALVSRLNGLAAHVNLIRLNPTSFFEGRPSSPEALAAFAAILDEAGIPHTLRQSRGVTIAAGCGQLRQRSQAHKSPTPR